MRGILELGNKLYVGGQILERIENDVQIFSLGDSMSWGRGDKDNEFGYEYIEFEAFYELFRCRCLIRFGNIRLEFSREVWFGDIDMKVISIVLITKVVEVNFFFQEEYIK